MIVKRGNKWCLLTKDGKKTLGCHDTKADAEEQERAVQRSKHMSMTSRCVHLIGSADATSLRVAKFETREHLVVPVVALREGVVHAVNSDHPELVLEEELQIAPAGWDGRPAVWDHPAEDGKRIGANAPSILERYAVGRVFNARIADKKLLLEGWLDMGTYLAEGQALIRRLQANEPVEVSVGVFVVAEDSTGSYNGKPYKAIWRNIVPDHLAFLPLGAVGACSISMGCGAPRAARAYIITAEGYDEATPSADNTEQEIAVTKCTKCGKEHEGECAARSLRERILSLIHFRSAAGEDAAMSDADLRNSLELALRAAEPGFMGVDSVFPAESTVVYAIAPDPSKLQFFRQGYAMGDKNAITLDGKREEVQPVTRFEPVNAEAAPPCGCHGEPKMAISKERIQSLIGRKTTPFQDVEHDVKYLTGLSEERFKELEQIEAQPVTPGPTPPSTPPTSPPSPPPSTPPPPPPKKTAAEEEDEFLAQAPESVRQIVAAHKAAEAARRTGALAALKAAQTAFTESDLAVMPTDQLIKLQQLAAVRPATDFGPAVGRAAGSTDDAAPEPIDMVARIRAARKLA